ncbi:alpha-N-acetylgalactosaminide alpha-2,6-sialyltransferase 2 isoform X2 [Myotis daubentonii]|uniref:alpha-N-acetylgalactosaminide alpha-2,6-sialyltransferase 2 isoform X2 n=1 Tax=Myotis daubentonii TaxID=98922 RepID=UPI0028737258|nr:alpha-N-acetylgalactosaminide alpha-2,6-sialyltransferase 2 isoform X2 [Myotis daubentonii]
MGLPRGPLFWRLLLLGAVSSGILLTLLSAAGRPHWGLRAGARYTTASQAFTRPKAADSGTRKGRPCRYPLAQAVQQDPHFRALFNFSQPVLLAAGLFSQELWDSLSQRRAPYGWQGFPRQDIASTLSLLNSSDSAQLLGSREPRRDCIRCAVVGNGGILNGSRQGPNIDAHDYVFRLNGAVIKGFEKDVGTKTSFYGFTVNTMKNSLIAYRTAGFTAVPRGQDLRYIFIPSDLRDYVMLRSAILGVRVPSGIDKGDRPQTYFGPEASASKFKLLHPAFISYLTERSFLGYLPGGYFLLVFPRILTESSESIFPLMATASCHLWGGTFLSLLSRLRGFCIGYPLICVHVLGNATPPEL